MAVKPLGFVGCKLLMTHAMVIPMSKWLLVRTPLLSVD